MTSQDDSSTPHKKEEDASQTDKKENETQEFGSMLLKHMEGQLNRADSKAQFTLTVDALLLASTTLFGKGIAITILDAASPMIARLAGIFSILMFVALLISTIYAILAVIPKLAPPGKVNNLYYYGTILNYKERDFLHAVRKQHPREMNDMLLSEVYALSSIAQQKFLIVRRSYQCLCVAVGFWLIAQGMTAFLR